jgi:hypothetical protein
MAHHMSKPLTAAEQNEIGRYINLVDPEHKRIFVDVSEDGWCIVMSNGSVIHPRTFLDIIRDVPPGEDILKPAGEDTLKGTTLTQKQIDRLE